MGKYCYLNGKIIETKKANISLDDIGILRGYGVFDYLRTFNGKPFLLKEHLTRFENSAKALGLKVPETESKIEKAIENLMEKNKYGEAGMRLVLTGGKTVNGIEFNNHPTFFILAEEFIDLPRACFEKGVKLITLDHQRILPKAKTTNYITAVRMQKAKRKKKAFEILYTQNDNILETTTANFFIFKKNRLITPKKDILFGTTRNFVIKLARKDFKIEEREVKKREVWSADEAFLTATNKDILPVVKIDGKVIGNGKVGENTKRLMDRFQKYVKKNV